MDSINIVLWINHDENIKYFGKSLFYLQSFVMGEGPTYAVAKIAKEVTKPHNTLF
jgi:hypothetical protein